MRAYFLNIREFCILSVAVGLLLAAAGCGSGDASSDEITVETGSLSKAAFIKKADAICEGSIKKVQLAGAVYLRSVESSGEPYAEQQREAPKLIETVMIPAYEKQIEEVSSLGAPRGDEKEVAKVLEATSQTLEEAKAEPVKFLQTVNPFAKAERTGKAYGFSSCGGLGFNY
jgi:hypothetical protein